MIEYGIVVHGGAGTPDDYSDGCQKACEAGIRLLESGASSRDAVIEAVRILEDDERFNAGFGSVLRMDGKTIEMDAALMDSVGNIGIVINVRHVKNPILLARAVLDTPHVALAGRGAESYAREIGLKPIYRISEESKRRYDKLIKAMKDGTVEFDSFWKKISSDTVGAVALDKNGIFSVAASTGGASPMMVGRVGDTPMIGCGFYSGEYGAVAVTGLGEEIIKKMPDKFVYDLLINGDDTKTACLRGLQLFPPDIKTGIVAMSKDGHATVSNKGMANYACIKRSEK
jgi:beta-aspartyl-peptidase (threonine type)